ncbi:hypothetical protein PGT21_029267 [Puccinia graminis f. sp. tritici]|uniref:Uncharacterized protein n=2 Tax=Puccinia graminis f. sp. tritici TaxID=56615 RepID=H6QQ96_PUCGT|nr:uncharacterized protein PGTG_21042 [Puccinia graminis f. sp. tritici CRL 75-36-700-3]EHS64782.1 hypothetical protein PGTG_21042 [Puccinia graminis f. sp. tritici CRL 75-36-700-3]KAA1119564.1 hypothetical protein PGT21_029267 [Puccinia graminis f. sp. tritici]
MAPPRDDPTSASPAHFGSCKCTPKASVTVKIRHARRKPSLTASSKHSYRFTNKGMELVADKGPLVSRTIPAYVIIQEYRAAARRKEQNSSPLRPN